MPTQELHETEGETSDERLNRNLDQLLQELRVALPGVQVLFAFLLVVPFNARFAELTAGQRTLYLGALLCSAVASALLIAPSVHHRVLFHRKRKTELVRLANRLAVTGMVVLGLAFTASVALVVASSTRASSPSSWRPSRWCCSARRGSGCRSGSASGRSYRRPRAGDRRRSGRPRR